MPHHVRGHHGHHGDHYHHHRQHSTPDFRFSIEMGLLVRSRHIDHATIQGLQKELSNCLAQEGVLNQHIADGNTPREGNENFREWTIAHSLAVPSKPKEHKFGLRLISPFMPFAWHDVWKKQVRAVLRVLNTDFETSVTHQCSTHIHLVPVKGYWRLSHAISLAKTAVYFEPCLDRLVPLYRRKSVWAKSNRWNHYLGKFPSIGDCLDRLATQTTFEGLAARMNWTARDSPTGRALAARQADFQHDGYRWNFCPAGSTSGYGTIEFRQLPGITESCDMISWVTLVVCFAQMGAVYGRESLFQPSKPAQLSKLAELVCAQADRSGVSKGRIAEIKETVFGQADAATTTTGGGGGGDVDPKNITFDEERRIGWVDKEGAGVGNTLARAKYWSLVEDLAQVPQSMRESKDGNGVRLVITQHW